MSTETWLDKLAALAERFASLGISDDLAVLSLTEKWGLYCFLQRQAERIP